MTISVPPCSRGVIGDCVRSLADQNVLRVGEACRRESGAGLGQRRLTGFPVVVFDVVLADKTSDVRWQRCLHVHQTDGRRHGAGWRLLHDMLDGTQTRR
jgi:hypothetical protein